jgi:hypothetical protein
MEPQVWLDAAKERFGFETWPRRLGAAALSRTSGFALNLQTGLDGWILERRLPHGDGGYADYFQQTGNAQHRVIVRVIEYPNHEAALEALLHLLSDSMAVTLPRHDAVGDVAFRGHGDLVTTLFFVRHNVLVDIRSIGDEPVSVLPFAALADAQIQAAAR